MIVDYESPPPRVAGTARGTTVVPLRLPHVDAVELRFLLVAERVVEFGQRSRRRLERLRHCAEAVRHGGETTGRCQGLRRLALVFEHLGSLGGRIVERLQYQGCDRQLLR